MTDSHTIATLFTALVVVGLTVPAASTAVSTHASDSVSVTVVGVTDGDTIDVRYDNGTTDTVRLLGVDTPETYGENTPGEFEGVPNTRAGKNCLRGGGEDAKDLARSTLLNERVTLVFDSEADRRGDYGRLLAYVRVDGYNFNYRLVDDGHARVYDSTFAQSERFYAAESDAQSAETNVWSCRTPESGDDLSITQIHEDAWGDDGDHLNDEYVVFENTGSDTLDLSGWTVTDEAGETYTFPAGFTLAPGETVTLHSGSGGDTSTDLYWGSGTPVWNNGGDTVTVSESGGTFEAAKSY